jgi:hypothetical protein
VVIGPTDSDTFIIRLLPSVSMVHTQTQGLLSFLLREMTPYLHKRSVIDSSNIAITDFIAVEGNDVCFRFLNILLTKCVKLTRVCLWAWSVLKLLTVFRKQKIWCYSHNECCRMNFYCCTVHSEINIVHSPTNAPFIKLGKV